MIELIPEPLSDNQAEKLREWLDDPAATTFKAVVESFVRTHQQKAVEYAMDGSEPKDKLSVGEIADARRYQNCLDVLRDVAGIKEFGIVKPR